MRSERFKLLVAILETIMVNSLKKNPNKAKSRKQLHFNVSLQWISLHAISGNTNLFWSLLLLRLELYVCLYLKTKIKRISAQKGRSFLLHHYEQISHIPIGLTSLLTMRGLPSENRKLSCRRGDLHSRLSGLEHCLWRFDPKAQIWRYTIIGDCAAILQGKRWPLAWSEYYNHLSLHGHTNVAKTYFQCLYF
jgi:hypothetical protein